MNRRQFLGRFFQAIISAHNSNSTYGIYHPWRQYEYNVLSSARIKLVYKYGVNSDGTYRQSSLMSISKPGTITAVYNSDGDMIYCSAYWRNGSIYNNFSDTIYLHNLKPGNYTFKVLQCGIGICPGPSGASMVFTVPEPPDRSEMPNNNYGPIGAPPAIEVTYVFDVSGLYFTYDVTITEVGKYYVDTDLFPCYRASYSAPSYETCESLYNAKAAEIGLEQKFDSDKYRDVILNGAEGGCPLTDEYYYVDAPIYYHYPTLKISYFEGASKNELMSINFAGYNPCPSGSLYWKICRENNLEYDPETQAKYNDTIDANWGSASAIPLTSSNGSWDEVQPCMYSYFLINNNAMDVESYVGSLLGNTAYQGAGNNLRAGRYRIKNPRVTHKYMSVAAESGTMPVYDKSGNATSYSSGELRLRMLYYMEGEKRKAGEIQYVSNTVYDVLPSPSGIIGDGLIKAKKDFANAYNDYAKCNEYGTVSPSNGDYAWYPIDALFGHIPPDKCMGKIPNPPGTYSPEAVYRSGRIDIKWSDFWGISSDSPYHLEPMLDGYTADLSQYDPNDKCNDSSMWIKIYDSNGDSSEIVFLRQNVLDIDTASIPDHRIG